MACAGVEMSGQASKEVPVPASIEAPENLEADTRECGFSEQSHGVVRLMEPPFMTTKDRFVLPQNQIREYTTEPYVLQYQVVEVDAQRLLEFLYRESEIADRECWATVLLKIFDEEPIEIYRDTLVTHRKITSSIRGAWVGSSREGAEYFYQFVVESNGAVSMSIRSKSKVFQVNQTESLPYHVLWEWDTEFFGPTDELGKN